MKTEKQKVLEWVKTHRKEAKTLWWWLCNSNHEEVANRLFVLHTQMGIPPMYVEMELERRYAKFLKDINKI